jgi:hypothetical protein
MNGDGIFYLIGAPLLRDSEYLIQKISGLLHHLYISQVFNIPLCVFPGMAF